MSPTLDAPFESDFSPRKIKVMIGCLLGVMLASQFLTLGAVSIVMTPMTHDFGWSRAGLSGAISLLLALGAISSMGWGRLIDRLGAKNIIVGGAFGIGLATMALAFSTSALWRFYLCLAALGVFGSTAVGYAKIISALFSRNRGKALGLFGMESALVGAVSPQITYQLEAHFGWRGMFIGLGLIIMAVAVALIFLLDEARIDGAPKAAANARPPEFEGLPISAVCRSPAFWLINLATMTGNITATGLLPHLVALVTSRGLSVQTAVTALSVHTLAIPVGQFCGGVLLDRVNTAKIAAPFAVVAFIGLLLIALSPTGQGGAAVLLLGAALLGFGNGAKRGMSTYFFTRYFGLRALAEVSGWSLAITALVLAPAPLVFGVIYDHTHSYNGALWILGAGLIAAGALYLALGPYRYAPDTGALKTSANG